MKIRMFVSLFVLLVMALLGASLVVGQEAPPTATPLGELASLPTQESLLVYVDVVTSITIPMAGSYNVGEGVEATLAYHLGVGEALSCSGDNIELKQDSSNEPPYAFPEGVNFKSTVLVILASEPVNVTVHGKTGFFCGLFTPGLDGWYIPGQEYNLVYEMTGLRVGQYLGTGDDPNRYGQGQSSTTLPNCTTSDAVSTNGVQGVDCEFTLVSSMVYAGGQFTPVYFGVYGEKGVPPMWNGYTAIGGYYLDFLTPSAAIATATPAA